MTDTKFSIGQQVEHKRFSYRGLIFDVDATFAGTEAWYQQMATSNPPKHEPWYHVMVHEADHTTYVAERNLRAHLGTGYIDHPLLATYFNGFEDGVYKSVAAH